MKSTRLFKTLLLILSLALAAVHGHGATLQSAFSYQGILSANGGPANGAYDMTFSLFRVGENAPGTTVSNSNVTVTQGLFTVSLDFGVGVFDGTAYELGIAVRQGSGGAFVTLQPRQLLLATPNAVNAQTVRTVADSALSGNVALRDAMPFFTAGIKLTTVRVTSSNGPSLLRFGPTDDCSIGIDPVLAGLILRDPRGVRVLNPNNGPSRLLFGPTDNCSIGIDPAFPGLISRDPIGFRLLGPNNQGCRLIFGPTMDCTVEVDPSGPQGILLRDPRGVRIIPRSTTDLPTLRFGPTDDCSIGIDPAFPGLIERDPIGFRLLGLNNQGCRLIFGPTMDCTVEVNPAGPQGLLLRDPKGIRILSPSPTAPPTLRFGPTDDCSIGIDPAFPGLIERDPIGFRLMGQNNQGCRLIFGPTMNCTVEVDPTGPQGLLLRDPKGIRILSPDAQQPPTLRFGPTDDCSIGIDPVLTGLILRDPRGLRIAPAGGTALPTLRFGPVDDCSIGIDPAFPGLLLRDPSGVRISSTVTSAPPRLLFGPTDLCSIEIRPPGTTGAASGLLLRDPSGIRVLNPVAAGTNRIVFGPTDDCRISVAPGDTTGMRFTDPRGFAFGSQVTVNGPVFAQAFVQTSSRRFKNDVKPIEEPLEKISKLQGVRFTWNEEKGGKQDVGFIAEDVAKVIPELVSMEEDGQNARGVNYDHLVAVAIEGIKAQQSKIETLEREKTELRQNLSSMQAQLDRLASQVEKLAVR